VTVVSASSPSPVGALEKLFAAVRPEFRADLIDIDAADPVFGGPPCRVAGCPRPGRAHGLCKGHRDRWAAAGRPDVAQFAAATKPTMHPAFRVILAG